MALCWWSYPSFMPIRSTIFNVQLIFDSYFAWTCFGKSSIFDYFKKLIKESVSNFRVECNKENYLKICAICAKQSARIVRICGRTKIGFCTMIIFGQKQHNNVAATTVFPRSAPCDFFLFPTLKRQKSKTSRNTSKQNSCQNLTEHSKWQK